MSYNNELNKLKKGFPSGLWDALGKHGCIIAGGATGAKQKAIEARAKAITELNNQGAGYSATHGQ